jgi:hypothetical protein
MFFFLLHGVHSLCDHHIYNVLDTFTALYEFTLTENQDVCISFIHDGPYIVFPSIPQDAQVYAYRQKLIGDTNYSLDFVLPAPQLPYALRNLAANTTFRILAPTGGLLQAGVVDAARCRSGVFSVAACSANLTFGTAQLQPYGLPLDTEKCILVLNTCETVIRLDLRLTPDDWVAAFDGAARVANLTGRTNATISREAVVRPLLIAMRVSADILAQRAVRLSLVTENCTEETRVLFLGPYAAAYPTSAPTVDPIVEKAVLEPAYIFGTLAVAVCFAVILGMSCFRYRWIDIVAGLCKKEPMPSPSGTAISASSRGTQRLTLIGMKM